MGCIEAGTRAAYSVIIIDRWGAILKWPEGIFSIFTLLLPKTVKLLIITVSGK